MVLWMPFCFFSVDLTFSFHFVAIPCSSTSDISYASKNCLKEWAIQLATHSFVGEQKEFKQLQNLGKFMQTVFLPKLQYFKIIKSDSS